MKPMVANSLYWTTADLDAMPFQKFYFLNLDNI
jgi:hypothetical protein